MKKSFSHVLRLVLLLAVAGLGTPAHAGLTAIDNTPMASAGTVSVKPNVYFILDNSGSMNDEFLPDSVSNDDTKFCYRNNFYNGVYYNAALTYDLPVTSAGAAYPNADFTAAKDNGFDTSATPATTDLRSNFTTGAGIAANSAYYYKYTGASPATPVRGTCYADASYTKVRLNTTETTTIAVGASNPTIATITVTAGTGTSTSVSLIKVGGTTITNGTSTGSTVINTVASNIAAIINRNGYSATAAGNVITISGPAAEGATLTITQSGGMVLTKTAFASVSTSVSGITVNGVQLMSSASVTDTNTGTVAGNIAARITLNGFSATASGSTVTITGPTSAANYTPLITTVPASGVMTFTTDVFPDTTAAKVQNFANWYSYYRNRLLTMKSAAGLAFKNVGNTFRVGFSTISYHGTDSTDAGFLKIDDFDATHKSDWYTKLYAASGNSNTPLRGALSKAGRIYAGKLLTGADDPMQYSCQQNFTILSTDGYWNTNTETSGGTAATNYSAYGINNTTLVGQQDGTAARPMNDGAIATSTEVSTWNSVSTKVTRTTQPRVDTTKTFVATTTQHLDTVKQHNLYSGFTANSVANATHAAAKNNSNIVRSNSTPSTVTVTTSAAHGYTTGDYVTIAGVGVAAINGTRAITVTGASTYTFVLAAKPSAPASPWGTSVKETWANGCILGQAKYTIQAQHYDNSTNKTSTVTTTIVNTDTIQTDTTTVVTTPKTRTVVTTNGVVTSDVTVSGSATTTTNVPPATVTVIPGTPVTTVSAAVITTQADTPAVPVWTDFGAATQSACAASMPASPTATTTFSTYPASPAGDTVTVLPVANTPGFPTLGVLGAVSAPTTLSGPTVVDGTVTTNPPVLTSTGGTSNSLADIAMYYYQTDLRTSTLGNCTGSGGRTLCAPDVCTTTGGVTTCVDSYNNVPGAGGDTNPKQHMTTFTLGLGVDGTLNYSDTYLSGGSSDYNAISQGSKNWPDPISNSGGERIDDLWHAAVDGRGVYYSARDPETLVSGLSGALAGVTARTGSAAAAATSNLEPVAGDNYLFVALYRTVNWDGDLQAKTIDPVTGAISSTPIWKAQPLLDVRTSPPKTGTNPAPGANSDTRTIYTFDSTGTNNLKPFRYANLTPTEKAYFDNMCTAPIKLNQCTALIADDITNGTTTATAASGDNLVNFLRGQQDFEDSGSNTTRLYRAREHVLGDMVSSQPVYVKNPPFSYADINYGAFKSFKAGRNPAVYVAVNDGMLHAFDGVTGQELWAYVPPMVLGNLYKLADTTYRSNHRFFVDGSPTVADFCPKAPAADCADTEWKTILVGGLNAGGRGYYALDITDPAIPKALWNFTTANDADLGLTYGNPLVTKRKDGTWVVVVTSGYNNVPGEPADATPPETTGDGNGHLYVLNANTGAILEKIATKIGGVNVGNTITPSGLAKINAKIDVAEDNTAEAFYGGDLLGNLWRFTLDPALPPSTPISTAGNAFLLAQLGNANGSVNQPITTKPELTTLQAGSILYTIVQVGTGRYLGDPPDRSNHDQQSVYAIKDVSSLASGWGVVRSLTNPATGMITQTLSNFTDANGAQLRTTTTNAIDWSTNVGWYVDFDPAGTSPGERVNVDVQLQLGSLTVATNVPSTNSCEVGGYSFLYNFDFKSGKFLPTATLHTAGRRLTSNALVAGLNTIRLQSGKIITIVTDTSGGVSSQETPSSGSSSGVVKRTSWRELVK